MQATGTDSLCDHLIALLTIQKSCTLLYPVVDSSEATPPPPEYHMKGARVSRQCRDIIFSGHSSSSCDDALRNVMTSTVAKRLDESGRN